MRRPLATLVLVVALAGCAGQRSRPTITATRRTATPAPVPVIAPATVARRFASAYAHYLDGELAADQLPNLSPTSRGQTGPVLPARARAGSLRVAGVIALSGYGRFVAKLRDHAHNYAIQVTVAEQYSRQQVVGLVAPDFDSVLEGSQGAIRQPSRSAGAERSARSFLAGYLPWLHGHGHTSAIHDATPGLVAKLKRHPPVIPWTLQGLHGQLVALGMQAARGGWMALANVTDGHQTYELTLAVARTRGHWLVGSVQAPS